VGIAGAARAVFAVVERGVHLDLTGGALASVRDHAEEVQIAAAVGVLVIGHDERGGGRAGKEGDRAEDQGQQQNNSAAAQETTARAARPGPAGWAGHIRRHPVRRRRGGWVRSGSQEGGDGGGDLLTSLLF